MTVKLEGNRSTPCPCDWCYAERAADVRRRGLRDARLIERAEARKERKAARKRRKRKSS